MNFFNPKSAAERYATGRPYFHPIIIQRVKKYLSLAEPFSRALDVGCGTGVTQSNIIAEVEGGRKNIEETRSWLRRNVEPLFGNMKEAEFPFNAPIWYLQRTT